MVIAGDKLVPGLAHVSAQNVVVFRRKNDRVLFSVSEKLLRAENAGNLDQLVVIVVAVEEGLFAKDLSHILILSHSAFYTAPPLTTYHACKHAAITPHIQAVIVFLKVDQELRSLEISGCNTDVILCSCVIELC